MSITRITITEKNRESVINYLAINHPGYKVAKEGDWRMKQNNVAYQMETAFNVPGNKTVVFDILTEEGLQLEIPLSYLTKGETTVLPMFITEEDCIDLSGDYRQPAKVNYALGSNENVISFKNFEIRNGKVIARQNDSEILNNENIIIIKG